MTLTLTQIGLLADIFGFAIIAFPALFWTKTGIPFLPKVGQGRWWVYLLGVVLLIAGFALQFFGAPRVS